MIPALKRERSQLEEAAQKVLDYLRQHSLGSTEVCGHYIQRTRVTLEKQDFQMIGSDSGFELGVRAISNEQQGFASSNSLDSKDLKDLAERVATITKISPKNPYNVVLPNEHIPNTAPIEPWDDSLFHISLETQKEWTQRFAQAAMADPKFRLNEGAVEITARIFLVISSRGTFKTQKDVTAQWSLFGMAVEGENITSFDVLTETSRRASEVQERLIGDAKKFRESLIKNLRNGNAQSYRGAVMFSPRAVVDVLLAGIVPHLNGRNIFEKRSRWNLESRGQRVTHPSFHLEDRPWEADRVGFSLFDREGFPTKNMTLIEHGQLKELLMDGYAATAMGTHSTGHALGGPSTTPMIGTHALSVAPGEISMDLLVKKAPQSFLEVRRFSGRVDPITGEFSGVAKGGQWWHGGERVYCVKETLISGNVFDCLNSALIGISQEVELIEASESVPTIFCDGVSVTVS